MSHNTRTVEAKPETSSWISGWTAEFIREEQLKDPGIGKSLRMKESNQNWINWKDISGEEQSIKAYWFLWKQLHIRSGVLYKLWEDEVPEKGVWQLVLPSSLREIVLQQLHDHVTVGNIYTVVVPDSPAGQRHIQLQIRGHHSC